MVEYDPPPLDIHPKADAADIVQPVVMRHRSRHISARRHIERRDIDTVQAGVEHMVACDLHASRSHGVYADTAGVVHRAIANDAGLGGRLLRQRARRAHVDARARMAAVQVAVVDDAILDSISRAFNLQRGIHRPSDRAALHDIFLAMQPQVLAHFLSGLRVGEYLLRGGIEKTAISQDHAAAVFEARMAGAELQAVDDDIFNAVAFESGPARFERYFMAGGIAAIGGDEKQFAFFRIVPPFARRIQRAARHDEKAVIGKSEFFDSFRHRVFVPGSAFDTRRIVAKRIAAGSMLENRASEAVVAFAEFDVEQAAAHVLARFRQRRAADFSHFRTFVRQGPFFFRPPIVFPRAIGPSRLDHHPAIAKNRFDGFPSRNIRLPEIARHAGPW
ncbi:MAG: hypothetical protein BWZ10_02305 [candidate division BRC1 bacterium ADurb.BinA364]|nr:MAG: hypothetical protein BWZ10_02305 [candidate division BRC1 bacterium ADurb.BinA364]